LLVAWIVYIVERRIDDGPIEISLSILTPYAAYFIADAAHASGVLAVVACGLFLTRRSPEMFSPPVRLQISSFWESFIFVLNGLVFVLIGLQLPVILASIRGYSLRWIILSGAIFSLVLILLRLAWVFPGSWLANFVHCRIHHTREKAPGPRSVFVVGWTGMRGVVSLAAALALPTELADKSPFPQGGVIVFLTFCVILVTLVLQGVTLPPLVRALGLEGSAGPSYEEKEARRLVTEAALSHLESIRAEGRDVSEEILEDLIGHYRHRLAIINPAAADPEHVTHQLSFTEISRETAAVERDTAVRLRNEGRINDQVLRRLERELDLNESRFTAVSDDD
jgi:CPA1 family monovalent cation:H+ antiporter